MGSVAISKDSVLIRSLRVSTRVTQQVAGMFEDADGGALLETMLGRYVLDRDGLAIWILVDGNRSIDQIVDELAVASELPATQLDQQVQDFCARLTELGLTELTDGTAQ
jgi:Coenzyme PQQ synthesis protein D (PqqD)